MILEINTYLCTPKTKELYINMRNFAIGLLVFASSTTTNVFGQTVTYQKQGEYLLINELMQSNIDCKRDDNIKEYPDSWVELYNNSNQAISLKGYKLGTSSKSSKAWSFPKGATIAANSLLLIYCDKEDAYDIAANRYQTNFRLDSGDKSNVYLFNGDEIVGSVTNMPIQPAPNIAYGRESNANSTWGYQLTPTPGKNNTGGVCTNKEILGEPVFSVPGKVMTSGSSFKLTLSVPEGSPSDTEIRYTDNGVEPTSNSPKYSGAITISESKVIRAKLFHTGWLSPRSTTHSYIFLGRQMTMPVISISTAQFNLTDPTLGIFAVNKDDDRTNHYNWRRPINIEYFEVAGDTSIINQLCETRVAGGYSRIFPRKTMNIYANKRFGKKHFEHEFFPDQKPGLKNFKSLALRNAGNDFTYLYLRDALAQRVMGMNTDIDWQAWRPAIVYINGQYYGMLNIRERAEEDNVYSNYDGLDNIDLLENWDNLKEGDTLNLHDFKELYAEFDKNGNLKPVQEFEDYNAMMDCSEFMNMMIMSLYCNNLDFPGGNIVMWRPRKAKGDLRPVWRWIAKDVDYAFGYGAYGHVDYNFDVLKWFYRDDTSGLYGKYQWANKPEHTMLFRQLMKVSEFKNEFLERYAIYSGDFLNAKGIHKVWDPMYDKMKSELTYMRNAVKSDLEKIYDSGVQLKFANYDDEKSYVNTWISKRNDAFMQQLCNKYGVNINTLYSLVVNKSETENLDTLFFNGHKLSENCFDAKYFKGHPIRLTAIPAKGKIIKGWSVKDSSGNKFTTKVHDAGASLTIDEMPSKKLLIEPILWLVGDFDNDNQIGMGDLNKMVSVIMKANLTEDEIAEYDLNDDQKVDAGDLVVLIDMINSKE